MPAFYGHALVAGHGRAALGLPDFSTNSHLAGELLASRLEAFFGYPVQAQQTFAARLHFAALGLNHAADQKDDDRPRRYGCWNEQLERDA